MNLKTFRLIRAIRGKWEPDSQKCVVFSPIKNVDKIRYTIASATNKLEAKAGFLDNYMVGKETTVALMEYIAWCLNHPNAIERAYRALERERP